MNLQRISRKSPISIQALTIITLILLIGGYLVYIPPTSLFIVVPLILLICIVLFLITGLFAKKKFQILVTLFCGVFLLMNTLIGFDLINTILLLSFIIAIGFLLK